VAFLSLFGETPLNSASILIGNLPDDTVRRLDVKSPDNDRTASPHCAGLSLTPTEICMLGSERGFYVGQFSLEISGPGYCFPRTPREIFDAIRTDPGVTPLLEILDSTWPTDVLQLEHARDLLSATLEPDLWPYDNIANRPEPPHWLWGVAET
jgi:hypothetical protein